ncbi:TPA: DUF47 family protein [Candidatus Geothermarchaeota archaeon]|nr:DUF47 family protein [Candidatus Geothermarchaeota archaeon]HIQ13249.1 DUF47 family protein [Thermoprotei archaeon]
MYRDSQMEAFRQIISSLQELSSKVMDMGAGVVKLTENVVSGNMDELSEIYSSLRELDYSIYTFQKSIINDIVRYKVFLGDSVYILYELITLVGDLVDEMDGAAFRLANLGTDSLSTWSIEWIRKIVNGLYREVEAFREAIYFLGYNPNSLPSAIERISEIEEEIDVIHRKALVEMFARENDGVKIVMWLEIVNRLENAADLLKRVGEILLSLHLL